MSVHRRLTGLAVACLCLLAFPMGGGSALAASQDGMTSYVVPDCIYGGIAPARGKGALMLCPNKRGTALAHVLPNGKLVRKSARGSGPIATGSSGEIWLGEANSYPTSNVGLNRLGPDGRLQAVPLGEAEESHELVFHGLVVDRQGTAWAALAEREDVGFSHRSFGGQLVRIDRNGLATAFRLPNEIEPEGLTPGPAGDIWFTGISGRESGEHSASAGVGYIGRMSPTGDFELLPVPRPSSGPESIAMGPDGRIWFTESAPARVGTVAPDGTFGREYRLQSLVGNVFVGWRPELTFDSEGNLWLVVGRGLLRLTPAGNQTLYRGETEGSSVATGSEGDIWWLTWKRVLRIKPGAPGLDIWKITADPPSRTLRVRLACGGSASKCAGELKLALRFPRNSRFLPKGVKKLPPFRLVETNYSVPAESVRTLVLRVPRRAFVLANRYGPQPTKWGAGVNVTATVVGGPPLERRIQVPAP